MKLYCIVDMVIDDDGDGNITVRSALSSIPNINTVVEVKRDPVTGLPAVPWGFARVSGNNLNPLRGRQDIDLLPDYPLSAKMGSMAQAERNALDAMLQRRAIPVSVGTVDSYRDVVRGLGLYLNPNFSEHNFDVSE